MKSIMDDINNMEKIEINPGSLIGELVQNRVVAERIEGKIDRIFDRLQRQDKQIDSLLDTVVGHKSGADQGLIVRVLSLEKDQQEVKATLSRLDTLGEDFAEMNKKLDKVIDMQVNHPSLLYKLRFDTQKTVMWIVLVFMLLSIWYVSGIRQPILQFLGLPVF